MKCSVHFAFVPAREIFGMVGRCGGGHNTVWEDWSQTGRANRAKIIQEFENGLDAICGHYTRLEKSIIQEGIRNPVVITCGAPVKRTVNQLPPELRVKPKKELLLLEGTTGGSRLWVAQKLNFQIPVIVNDWTGRFAQYYKITNPNDAAQFYKDKPARLSFDSSNGLVESFDRNKVGHHLGVEWSEEKIILQRAPLWVSIMNRYGYYVDRLPAFVNDILRNAGVEQPLNLKNRQIY